jgi:hypothetical protein
MDSVQPRIHFFWNEEDPCLAYKNAECPRMAIRGETQTRRWVPFGIGPIHPSHDFHAVPPRITKRDELVVVRKVSSDRK